MSTLSDVCVKICESKFNYQLWHTSCDLPRVYIPGLTFKWLVIAIASSSIENIAGCEVDSINTMNFIKIFDSKKILMRKTILSKNFFFKIENYLEPNNSLI